MKNTWSRCLSVFLRITKDDGKNERGKFFMTNIDKTGYKTVEIRVYGKDKEPLKQELVLCAYEIQTGKILGLGKAALEYVENENVAVINPLKWGAVGDFVIFSKIMENYIKEVRKSLFRKPRLAICVPAILTDVQKMAFIDSVASLSRNTVCVIDKSFSQLQVDGSKELENDVDIYLEFISDYYESEYYQ